MNQTSKACIAALLAIMGGTVACGGAPANDEPTESEGALKTREKCTDDSGCKRGYYCADIVEDRTDLRPFEGLCEKTPANDKWDQKFSIACTSAPIRGQQVFVELNQASGSENGVVDDYILYVYRGVDEDGEALVRSRDASYSDGNRTFKSEYVQLTIDKPGTDRKKAFNGSLTVDIGDIHGSGVKATCKYAKP